MTTAEAYQQLSDLLNLLEREDWKDGQGYVFRVRLLRQIGLAIQEAYANGGGGGGASDLEDLTDVSSATATDKYALLGNGTTFASRAIVEADISDLKTYLQNLLEDTTPQLGGNLDVNGNDITSTSDGDVNIYPDGAGTLELNAGSGGVNITTTAGNSDVILNPHGTGDVVLGGMRVDGDQPVGPSQDGYGLIYDHSASKTYLQTLAGKDSTAIHDNVDGEINAVTTKGTPVTGDVLLIEDSAASFAKKKATVGSLPYAATSHTHAASAITSGTFADARISQSSVTQHQSALSIGNGNWDSSDLTVTNGGTGASNASGARTNLGLVIGTDVQAYDAQLADIAGMTPTDSNFIVGNGTNFVLESGATVRTSLGLGTTDSPQFTGVNVGHASDTTITRTGAGDIAVEGNTIYRAGGTDVPLTDGGTGASTAAGARTNLGLVPGADVDDFRTMTDVTGNGSLAITDRGLFVDCGGSTSTINLPTAAAAANLVFFIVKVDAGAFTVRLTPNGADTINGAANYDIAATQYKSAIIASNGITWMVVGGVI